MKVTGVAVIALTLAIAGTASAQESAAGAGRVEVGGFPGGGTFFTKGSQSKGSEPSFKDYALGGSAMVNFNRRIGVEGEIGAGIGVNQTFDFSGGSIAGIKGPNTLAYNGNLVYNPGGSDRSLIPYVTGGLGGLTLFSRTELAPLGLSEDKTYLSENVGGGLRWYANEHVGIRGDYRFIMVNGEDTAPSFFGLSQTRHGHRVYGGVLFTFGR
jgi:opacity protein-like surface antigen